MSHLSRRPSGYTLSQWQQLYQAAIMEIDPTKLSSRITEARQAIHDRAEDILTSSSLAEHRSINSALRTLKVLEEVAEREKNAA